MWKLDHGNNNPSTYKENIKAYTSLLKLVFIKYKKNLGTFVC